MAKEMKRVQALQTMKTIAETLNEANDLQEMLPTVLRQLIDVTGLECGWIFWVEEDGTYTLMADYELPPALMRENKKPMCEGICWCLERYQDGRLKNAVNIIECKRLKEAIVKNRGETNGITHHATVPLRAGDEQFGILNVASPHKQRFSKEELALLESVAYQIGTAIKRIKLVENEQKLALLAERNRLARDLHDSVSQLLFSLLLTASGAKEIATEENIKEALEHMQTLAQEALHEMRALIWQLRPQGLENGVASALMNYSKMLGLNVKLDIEGVLDLPNEIEQCLWRVGQEALNNCKKHAGVSEVEIMLSVQNERVAVKISDKGCGFHYTGAETLSLGLKSMKERVEAVNGVFSMKSSIGKGTAIELSIPLKKEGKL
ncbi:GAF domain protein [Anoxybacillus sp. B7M1]|jgi:two-component system, NarL family, sensor kinase|uniref:GAF domain-containing sensor histidine kinase n=1 Tax=unclassified Anoxybacillus TaxID=2639704 RepID=UPI0005CD6E86|nr:MULTISPECIES: GAF domain-containing sensor histidine kinase [unclassified Anoxybacillus]ANB57759.1 GAF domain protein [Anoxybacillus sp. B2M1]ANB64565.1 GAF domain protein [Anoxybacillus sp. B7M1]OQM46455.1 histidine kinase [Anoxybacillus sp. UARK-01]